MRFGHTLSNVGTPLCLPSIHKTPKESSDRV